MRVFVLVERKYDRERIVATYKNRHKAELAAEDQNRQNLESHIESKISAGNEQKYENTREYITKNVKQNWQPSFFVEEFKLL